VTLAMTVKQQSAAAGRDRETSDDAPSATALQTRTVLRLVLLLLVMAGGFWLIYLLRGVILLVALSLFFAYLIAPLVDLVSKPIVVARRQWVIRRTFAIAIVYLTLLTALGIAGDVLLPRLSTQATEFGKQVPVYIAQARGRLDGWRQVVDSDGVPSSVSQSVDRAAARTTDAAADYLSASVASLLPLLGYLPWLILIPIVAFFLLKDAEAFRQGLLRALPRGRLRWRGADLVEDINATMAAYMRAAVLGCLLIGVICTIGFIVIGVPYGLLLGVVAGLLEFIPLVGPLAVALGTTLIAGFHSLNQAVMVLLFLAVLRVAQDYVIFPRLVRRGIHMHPLGVILAILCGAELAGIAGIFLAIPLVAVLSVSYRHWLAYRGSDGLVADLLQPAEAAALAEPARASSAPHQLP
jgi:predicted PurR-regulated permease PerM